MMEGGGGIECCWTSHCDRLQLHNLMGENSINNRLSQCLVINFLHSWRFIDGNFFL